MLKQLKKKISAIEDKHLRNALSLVMTGLKIIAAVGMAIVVCWVLLAINYALASLGRPNILLRPEQGFFAQLSLNYSTLAPVLGFPLGVCVGAGVEYLRYLLKKA